MLKSADKSSLKGNAKPIGTNPFRDFTWFDLDQAKNIVTAGGGPSAPEVWVDQARGVFYFRKTD